MRKLCSKVSIRQTRFWPSWGVIQEAVSLLQRQMTARFGTLSTTTTRRLAKLTLPELEDLAIRFVTAKNVNDLFRR